ncbi:hypothetical protein [Methanosarcina mazei]|uniref:Uncharacterized protein n=1 Tax=Methanosarcina mazei TaxID=2209 RepID=A0A0F8NR20_METMZ|nr:hypothetical protein [Methanosarcina mazei]KKH53043.1 hypothetical protein DU85_05670 [Methanosarcina mazei]
MLGDLIYEAMGKTTGMRVLDDNGTVEMTLEEKGNVFGIECTLTLTVVGKNRPKWHAILRRARNSDNKRW